MTGYTAKEDLLTKGVLRMHDFCKLNELTVPKVVTYSVDTWRFATVCAYYRPTAINICVARCAAPGYMGRMWSWPGYVVDRTPYGVIAHELGHHVDITKSSVQDRYTGDFSEFMRRASGEDRLTTYCPNDGEWFAEMFRLFVTNPDLLHFIRPRTYRLMKENFKPVDEKGWHAVMQGAPERYHAAIGTKIAEAVKMNKRLDKKNQKEEPLF